jgi:hypothetical protein
MKTNESAFSKILNTPAISTNPRTQDQIESARADFTEKMMANAALVEFAQREEIAAKKGELK